MVADCCWQLADCSHHVHSLRDHWSYGSHISLTRNVELQMLLQDQWTCVQVSRSSWRWLHVNCCRLRVYRSRLDLSRWQSENFCDNRLMWIARLVQDNWRIWLAVERISRNGLKAPGHWVSLNGLKPPIRRIWHIFARYRWRILFEVGVI